MNEQVILDGGGTPAQYGFREFLFQDLIPSYVDYTAAKNQSPTTSQQLEQTAYRIPEQRGTAQDNTSQFLFGVDKGTWQLSGGTLLASVALLILAFKWKG